MISRAHRFHGYGSLRHVYKKGLTTRGPMMSVRYLPNDRRRTYRAAVVVSRKVNKSAVARNRIRRRVYEIIRQSEPQISRSFDIVITVFSDQLEELSPAKLTKLVRLRLEQAGVLSGSKAKANTSHDIVKPKKEN